MLSVAKLPPRDLVMSGELEMVYCSKCREFFEADCFDLGTYFCERCRKKKNDASTMQLDVVLKKIVNDLLEKQKQKGIK